MASDRDFLLAIDLSSFHALDDFALLACQKYNFGNEPNWFISFRGGLYGMYARLYGLARHFYDVHTSFFFGPHDAEYHLASALFAMDSSLECFTFGLNALGWAVDAAQFHSVTDPDALKKITPNNIAGKQPMPGYSKYFPSLQTLWRSHGALIQTVIDQHDVSKHRSTIFKGGKLRKDAIDALGGDPHRFAFAPMEEIMLVADPKQPSATRGTIPLNEQLSFESVAHDFVELVRSTGVAALGDAKANIRLKEPTLRR